MDIEQARARALEKPGAVEDAPFGEDVPVYKVGGKIFMIAHIEPPHSVNLKCDPERAIELRERREWITPGYHMNKRHWNTVELAGAIDDREIETLIDHSYDLVFKSLKKSAREEIAGRSG
jgi:predicted DNA-binding protein (MmcQ/YjbR family)